mgnify:CR=1 FL=1
MNNCLASTKKDIEKYLCDRFSLDSLSIEIVPNDYIIKYTLWDGELVAIDGRPAIFYVRHMTVVKNKVCHNIFLQPKLIKKTRKTVSRSCGLLDLFIDRGTVEYWVEDFGYMKKTIIEELTRLVNTSYDRQTQTKT